MVTLQTILTPNRGHIEGNGVPIVKVFKNAL